MAGQGTLNYISYRLHSVIVGLPFSLLRLLVVKQICYYCVVLSLSFMRMQRVSQNVDIFLV
jgi:hypothetical protein